MIINIYPGIVHSIAGFNFGNSEALKNIGYTPLLMAASPSLKTENADKIVKYLLRHGANVTVKGSDGFTMFNWAIKNGNHTIILEFIKFGMVNATSETKVCRSTHYKSEWCEDLITWATKRRLSGIF